MRRNGLVLICAALAAVLACAALLAAPEEVEAAFPGQNGRIVFVNDTCQMGCAELHAQDVGEAASVPLTANNSWNAEPSYAYGGKSIVFIHGDDIAVMPSSGGAPEVLKGDPDGPFGISLSNPSLSPDGETLLYRTFDRDTREGSVYTAPVSGGEPTLIAGGDRLAYSSPEWSPDGRRISYYVNSAGRGTIFTVPASGGAPTFVTDEAFEVAHSWSPGGGRIAFVGRDNARGLNVLYAVPSSGGGAPRPVHESDASLGSPAYSPDGRYLAFESFGGPSQKPHEIFVVPSDGGTPEQVTRARGASEPDWQPVCPCPEPPADVTEPTVTNPRPLPGSAVRDRTPTVAATVRDGQDTLAKADITLRVDGARRSFSYDPETGRLSRPTGGLSYGRHSVKVVATDGAGNLARKAWSFRVVAGR